MWFTDYRFLNDPSEFSHGMEIACAELLNTATDINGRARLLLECAADMFSSRNMEETLAFLVVSFSRARDDLGQWRAYADNGRGVAIGFAPHMFHIQNTLNSSPDENSFFWVNPT